MAELDMTQSPGCSPGTTMFRRGNEIVDLDWLDEKSILLGLEGKFDGYSIVLTPADAVRIGETLTAMGRVILARG
jgi:hypothetical protein